MNVAQVNNINFNGLWGKEKVTSDYGETMGYENTDRYYHPFQDESLDEIKSIQEKYTKNSVNHNGGQYTIDYFEHCHINDKLGFTKAEWAQYTKDKKSLATNLRIFIEESLRRADLKHYIK